MADNNENSNVENTDTESLKSTPIMNRVSLEDLFQLMQMQNGQLNSKLNQFDEQLSCLLYTSRCV